MALELHAYSDKTAYGVRIDYIMQKHLSLPQAPSFPTRTAYRDVTCLKSGYLRANAAMYQSAQATARIWRVDNNGSVTTWCTGTLIDRANRKDVMITAAHCLSVHVFEFLAEIGAEYSPDCSLSSNDCLSLQHAACEGTYYTARAWRYDVICDWGLLTLDGNPGEQWSTIPVGSSAPIVGDVIYVIHHARGYCKTWDEGTVDNSNFNNCSWSYWGAQTGPSASGSSIRLKSSNQLVGVHRVTGEGVALRSILPTLTQRVQEVAYSGRRPTGMNVALNSIRVDTSSNFDANHTGVKAIDGVFSVESKWVSANLSGPYWLKLDLGQEPDLIGFGLFAPSYVGENGYNPKVFVFQTGTSYDGPWTDEFQVAYYTGNQDVTYRGFPDITKRRRYVRLLITDANSTDQIARVVEFEVYAGDFSPTATPVAPTNTPGQSLTPTSTPVVVPTDTPTSAPFCMGDAHRDGFVNGDDFRSVRDNFGQGDCGIGDANGDCFVNGEDFRVVRDHFGQACLD